MDDRFSATVADPPDPDSERSIRQIEWLLADHDIERARLAFELTAWGAAAAADEGQLASISFGAQPSMKTRRAVSKQGCCWRQAMRAAATSGRACSLPRATF